MNQLKKVNAVQTTDTSNLKKLTVTQFTSDTKIGEIEKKIIMIIVTSVLLFKSLIS